MKRNKIILAAFVLVALGACSNEHEPEMKSVFPEDGIIRIDAGVNNLVTRAGATTDNVSSVGVFIDSPNNNYDYSNILFEKESNGNWKNMGELMLWADKTSSIQATVYAPYNNSEGVGTVDQFNVRVFRNQNEESYYTRSDFVYESKTVDPTTDLDSEGKISFALNHAFSRLDMSFTRGSSVSGITAIQKVQVQGVAERGTLNMLTGALTCDQTYCALTCFPITRQISGNTPALYSVILMPQTVEANDMTIVITVTENSMTKDYVFTVENKQTFAGNTKYTTDIKIGPDNGPVVINSVGLTGWQGNTVVDKKTDE